jgi:ribosomal protein L11
VFIEIHAQNRKATIHAKPGVSAYLIKEMGGFVPRDRKKEKLPMRSGNITFD